MWTDIIVGKSKTRSDLFLTIDLLERYVECDIIRFNYGINHIHVGQSIIINVYSVDT